jgi:hypothetical protein
MHDGADQYHKGDNPKQLLFEKRLVVKHFSYRQLDQLQTYSTLARNRWHQSPLGQTTPQNPLLSVTVSLAQNAAVERQSASAGRG